MDQPLISVIVPVYNTEKYLDFCLESLQNQTYSNLEILLIDNGSSDHSPAICDQWAKKDSRFRVTHQPNNGVLGARSAGLAQSRGDYLAFVDSDDFIHPQMLALLLAACEQNAVPCCGCLVRPFVGAEPATEALSSPESSVFSAPDHLDALLHSARMQYSLCNKLYHRNLLEGISFDFDLSYNEDLFLNWNILQKASGFALLDFDGYFYRQHSQSASHLPPSDKVFADQIYVAEYIRDASAAAPLADSAWAFYYEKLLYLYSMILRRKDAVNYDCRRKMLLDLLRSQFGTAMKSSLSPIMKLTAILSCRGGVFYRLLCRLLLTDRR